MNIVQHLAAFEFPLYGRLVTTQAQQSNLWLPVRIRSFNWQAPVCVRCIDKNVLLHSRGQLGSKNNVNGKARICVSLLFFLNEANSTGEE